MTLERIEIHDCRPPEVPIPTQRHRWTCRFCKAQWTWSPRVEYSATEYYGFLGLRSRAVTHWTGGHWWVDEPGNRSQWVEA